MKQENEPLAFVRAVAASLRDWAAKKQTAEQIQLRFVELFRKKLKTQDDQSQVRLQRDDCLQFNLLSERVDRDLFKKVSAAVRAEN